MKQTTLYCGTMILVLLAISCFHKPKDIRNDFLKAGITDESRQQGRDLLHKMEQAYGGREAWDSLTYGEFIQIADWYGRTPIAHWDTLPQRYRLRAVLGSHDCELQLLNGPNTGLSYKIQEGTFMVKAAGGEWQEAEENSYAEKMIFKNYWFQFPFRIGEASIISYAGEEELEGTTYQLLYATWGEEAANSTYDQFLMYVHPTSFQIEYLYFTVREKLKSQSVTARFDSFRQAGPFVLPHSQFVSVGRPAGLQVKAHENHYQSIVFE
ncbi:MAG: hypothetical protein AAF587_24500 [Bacteroidota bacterium]